MKTLSLALISILLLLFGPICSTQAQSDLTDQGIDVVEVVKTTATVEKIDLEKRKVTLLLEDGNLAQVKAGDHRKMSFTEEIAIVFGKSNETPGALRPRNKFPLHPTAPTRRRDGGDLGPECTSPGSRRTDASCDLARSGW